MFMHKVQFDEITLQTYNACSQKMHMSLLSRVDTEQMDEKLYGETLKIFHFRRRYTKRNKISGKKGKP